MGFFTWFLNLFRSNKTILQLFVMSAAGEIFKANPKLKLPVAKVLSDIIAMLNFEPMSLVELPALIKDKVKYSGLLVPEQALVLTLIDALTPQIATYFTKSSITSPVMQTQAIVEILGWVKTMATL